MALITKNRTKNRTTASSKRRGRHHKRSNSYAKPYWPYLPMLAIVTLGLVFSSVWQGARKDVMGYATETSAPSLLSGTNSQRTANGLGALALNSLLSQAAQNKANDMMTKDYWSHTSPDGSTPWTFIDASGYAYSSAGENLAYGFATSNDVINGWMNSPKHRDNILGAAYNEIGFGIVNAPNYQKSGPQTIVVAMYGQAATHAPAATAPASAQSAGTPQPATTDPAQNRPATVSGTNDSSTDAGGSTASSAQAPTAETPRASSDFSPTSNMPKEALTALPSQDVPRVKTLSPSKTWTPIALGLLGIASLAALLLRHTIAWRRVWRKGEKFVLKHPVLDLFFILILVAGFVLTRTAGFIR
ncbi:MAG: hypothetical protein QG629_61 [Patescibacteria group bacterium]|nr:hypothetical protein [Candidatus Saccharibacteria bacterium]MDQ5962979.1 hypothetical protein [Patescibacteria group bacterium]